MKTSIWLPDFKWPEPEDMQDQQILAKVHTNEWAAMHVPNELGEPEYFFTVGHYLYHQRPEVLVVGAPQLVAQQLLRKVALHAQGKLPPLQVGREYPRFIDKLSVAFIPMKLEYYNQYLGFNNWFYGSLKHTYPAVQLVWADMNGAFPWQRHYDSRFSRLQPVLGDQRISSTPDRLH